MFLLCGLLFFLFEYRSAEKNQVHRHKQPKERRERDPDIGEVGCRRIGGEPDWRDSQQQQHRETEHDCPELLIDEVACGRRFEERIDLAQEDDARARGAREHAVEREERLRLILGIDALADDIQLNIGSNRTDDADDAQRNECSKVEFFTWHT